MEFSLIMSGLQGIAGSSAENKNLNMAELAVLVLNNEVIRSEKITKLFPSNLNVFCDRFTLELQI